MKKPPSLPRNAPPATDRDAVAIDAFERLPEDVREEIVARRRRLRADDERYLRTNRRERFHWGIGVAVGVTIAAQMLPVSFPSTFVLGLGSGLSAMAVSRFSLGGITGGILFCVQAGIVCALTVRMGGHPRLDLMMVFCFIVLQMVVGVLLGMKEEGCLTND